MKLAIERAALLKSLGHVQSVVERRTTIPILSNVRLEAADGSWRVENAYAFTGGTARSQVDNRELPVNELLPALRDAAAQEAAAD